MDKAQPTGMRLNTEIIQLMEKAKVQNWTTPITSLYL